MNCAPAPVFLVILSLFRARNPTMRPFRPVRPAPCLARGHGIIIRDFEREDVDRWMAWPPHTDVLFTSYNAPSYTRAQADDYWRERLRTRTSRQYSVDSLDGEFVGRISLREIDPLERTAVLGVTFHPDRLNRGLGSDALSAFLGYYFGRLRMSALLLDVAAFNRRAIRVYEKNGFRPIGKRWGDPETDYAGVLYRDAYRDIRHLFRWDGGMIRPLVLDMVLEAEVWESCTGPGAWPRE